MEQPVETVNQKAITSREYCFVVVWAVCCLFAYGVGGYLGVSHLRSNATDAARNRWSRIESWIADRGAPQTSDSIPSLAKPGDVHVGLSMTRVEEILLKESAWTADFILSFRWTGETAHPVESFHVANGQIVRVEKRESFTNGTEHYAEFNVVARMTRRSSDPRFPMSNEWLIIDVEDTTSSASALRYVADPRNSEVRPNAIPGNVDLVDFNVGTEVSGRSSVPLRSEVHDTSKQARSHFIFAMLVTPDSFGIYQRLFRALFGAVAISLIVLFIRPQNVDPRFGLPVGGFFAAVTNTVSISSILPYSDRITLVDMVNVAGLFTIFLILVQSAISLRIEESGRERLTRLFDRVSFAIIIVAYVVLNLALPMSARSL